MTDYSDQCQRSEREEAWQPDSAEAIDYSIQWRAVERNPILKWQWLMTLEMKLKWPANEWNEKAIW